MLNSITSILMVIYPGRVAVVIASGETLFGVGLAIGIFEVKLGREGILEISLFEQGLLSALPFIMLGDLELLFGQ